METTDLQGQTARYRALCSRDARFDGGFFVGVTSTGIYCRPVCRVRTPRRENCRFFELPAQAEQAGFRPCLRCRPEMAPSRRHWSTTDATHILVRQALCWLDDPSNWRESAGGGSRLQLLAERLGVSDRHLRRVFEAHLGVSPLQYLQTCRLLTAKQLLTDTRMPVSDVALASGFSSLRRFNAAFAGHYRINPSQMRRQPTTSTPPAPGATRVRLAWRPPLDISSLTLFFAQRQVPGVESFEHTPRAAFMRTVRLTAAGQTCVGWIAGHWAAEQHALELHISDGLLQVLPSVIRRVRDLFDLDAEPEPINATLLTDFPGSEGMRVPGCLDGFELAVRAVLGQQVTVAAARTLAARLVERWGDPIHTPFPELRRLFPTPAALATADDDALGSLGIVRQRQAALKALARSTLAGELDLSPSADLERTLQTLQRLPGIGPWTAQYIAMRALKWPDAWPPGDVALIKPLLSPGQPLRSEAARREADRKAEAWRPWRSYAVIRTWAGTHRSSHPPDVHTTP